MINRYLLFFLCTLSLLATVSLVSADVETAGPYRQGKSIEIVQICNNCTYNNITSIVYVQNSTIIVTNVAMTKSGTRYNYTLVSSKTVQLGRYVVTGVGDLDGNPTVWSYDFYVTPAGNENVLGLFIILIVMAYGIGFFGFFGKNVWVSILGGMAMMALGIYTINNGIDIYRNFMTNVFSITTIGLGAIFALIAGVELINDNL